MWRPEAAAWGWLRAAHRRPACSVCTVYRRAPCIACAALARRQQGWIAARTQIVPAPPAQAAGGSGQRACSFDAGGSYSVNIYWEAERARPGVLPLQAANGGGECLLQQAAAGNARCSAPAAAASEPALWFASAAPSGLCRQHGGRQHPARQLGAERAAAAASRGAGGGSSIAGGAGLGAALPRSWPSLEHCGAVTETWWEGGGGSPQVSEARAEGVQLGRAVVHLSD